MLIDDPESIHRNNLAKLIGLYGINKEREIRDLYQQYRSEIESKATIPDHIPFFTYQQTETSLNVRHGKPKTQSPKTQSRQSEQPETQKQEKRKGLLRLLRL